MPHPRYWHHQPGPMYWRSDRQDKRRFLIGRFILFIGFLALLFLCALLIIGSLAFGSLQEAVPRTLALALILCGVPFVFLLLLILSGRWVFRRYGAPMVEVMAAADAVAEGDLSVRVSEEAPGEMGRLAHSFNRMTAELERSEQQRRNLTADVAHELRTPLHVIQGNLEGVLDGVYQPTPEHLQATLEETRLLRRLVDDLQTLSLAEAGQLPLHRVRLLAADLLQDAATSFAGQAAEAGVRLELRLEVPPQELEVEVDPDRMGQVLNNLVANALRYTPESGEIVLSAERITDGIRLSVQDNGPGIPAEDLPYVFDRFWRGDRTRGRSAGAGSGLGLAIARQLVLAHGGRINVESQVGKGTSFAIDLPNPLH